MAVLSPDVEWTEAEALGWDAWRGRAEVIVPYFIASGTGKVIAQFPIAA